MAERENDVIGMVPPDTGAQELELTDESNPDVALPVALYLASAEAGSGTAPIPTMLFRFRPTLAQRGRIALGEDLYLVMLLPNQRAPLAIDLQVGAGTFQLNEQRVTLVDDEPLRVRGAVWTPEGEPG